MLAASADRLSAALAGLDPGSRALLDLSLRQGVADAEIGELLGKPPGQVAEGRDDVLELLADALAVDGDDRRDRVRAGLLELPDAAWQAGRPPRAAAPPPAPPRPPAPAPSRAVRSRRRARRLDRRALLALAGVVAAAALVTILLLSGGEEGDERDRPGSGGGTGTQPAPPADGGAGEGGPTARLEPLAGRRGRGTVRLDEDGERLAVSIAGLPQPEGAYEIWLYSSIVDARSLGSFRQRRVELDARLSDDPRDYRWIDVSHEPDDGNPNHSGESVLRVPVGALLDE